MPGKGNDDTRSPLSLPSSHHPQELREGGECCEGVLTRAIGACRICNGHDNDVGDQSTGSQKQLSPTRDSPRGECTTVL